MLNGIYKLILFSYIFWYCRVPWNLPLYALFLQNIAYNDYISLIITFTCILYINIIIIISCFHFIGQKKDLVIIIYYQYIGLIVANFLILCHAGLILQIIFVPILKIALAKIHSPNLQVLLQTSLLL